MSFFKWETLTEVARHDLHPPNRTVPGKMMEVQLVTGPTIRAWRSDDGTEYFCHGLTFGGKVAPGGAISPYTGPAVETILQSCFLAVSEDQARPGDILVWFGIAPETTPHSAVLTVVALAAGKGYLDESATRLQTKNGFLPETNATLGALIGIYGESYNTFRAR